MIFKKAITHNKEKCDIHHVDSDNFDKLKDKLKYKAHAVCLYKNKMLIVKHPEWNIWGIPGGTREIGETIEETLKREILEETNCRVINYYPIAYQKVISSKDKIFYYRLQYLCEVEPVDKFIKDPAGNINEIKWISPDKFEKYIEDKEFKKIVIRRAFEIFNKNNNKKKGVNRLIV